MSYNQIVISEKNKMIYQPPRILEKSLLKIDIQTEDSYESAYLPKFQDQN